MNKTWCDYSLLKSALLLIILICLIYSNTLDSPWILDDYYNITDNTRIHIARLDIDSVKNAAYGAPIKTGGLYRPVAYLTFGLNWYWGHGNVTGYHVVNIVIHTLPLPPVRLAHPRTTAVIAKNSIPIPAWCCPEATFEK